MSEELINKIPANWRISTIGDVSADVQYGYTTKGASHGSLRMLRTTDITSGEVDWNGVPYCTERPEDEEKYLIHEGDVLISRAGSVGFSYFVKRPERSVFASYLIRFKPTIEGLYFKRFLESPEYWQNISEKKLGIAIPNVNASKLKAIQIPIAPLNEQRRIVARLEELFSTLDKSVEYLRTAQAQLKVYRQSLLKHAFEGKLTEKWREKNDSTPGSQAETNDETDSWEIPKNWRWAKLESLLAFGPRNGFSPKPSKSIAGTKSLTLTATTSGRFDSKHFKYLDVVVPKDSHLWLKNGDILIQRGNTREYVGVSAVYNGPENAFIYPDLMMKMVPVSSFSSDYICYALSDERTRNFMRQRATGTAGSMPKINKEIVQNVPIPVCCIAEQNEIVERLEEMLSNCDRLREIIEGALVGLEALRQSILKQAFSGKLVPQDPNDEPASVLLERIKAVQANGNGSHIRTAKKPKKVNKV